MLFARSTTRSAANRRPSCRLQVQSLEERAVPATAVFQAGVLTVTAAANETITITPIPGQPAGVFNVSDGSATPVFNSTSGGTVTSLVTDFRGAGQGTLVVDTGLQIDGFFRIRGALDATTVTLGDDVSIGKSFNFIGTKTGNDIVAIGDSFVVGQAARFNLGGGDNALTIEGATVGRGVAIRGRAGADTVVINGDTSIARSLSINLGRGFNQATIGFDTKPVTVGGNLTYRGGSGDDVFSLGATTITRHLKVNLGAATGQGQKLNLGESQVVFTGQNQVALPTVNVGGNTNLRGGNGINNFQLDYFTVQGRLNISTGAGDDTVILSQATVTNRTSVRLGAGKDTFESDATMTSLVRRVVIDSGLNVGLVARLVDFALTNNLPGTLLGNLITGIITDGIASGPLSGLAGELSGLLLGKAETSSLLGNLQLGGVLALIQDVSTYSLSASTLGSLLGFVGHAPAQLLVDVTTLLGGLLNPTQITVLVGHLLSADLTLFMNSASGAGLTNLQLGSLLTSLNGLNLTSLQLTDFLGNLSAFQLDCVGLGTLLNGLAAETLELVGSLPVIGNWGDLLVTVITYRATDSRYSTFRLWGGRGEDTLRLGTLNSKVTFTGMTRLKGGRDIDTLTTSAWNTYATPAKPNQSNYEDFENGSL